MMRRCIVVIPFCPLQPVYGNIIYGTPTPTSSTTTGSTQPTRSPGAPQLQPYGLSNPPGRVCSMVETVACILLLPLPLPPPVPINCSSCCWDCSSRVSQWWCYGGYSATSLVSQATKRAMGYGQRYNRSNAYCCCYSKRTRFRLDRMDGP